MENALYRRNYSLDVARIVAVLAVLMIHCSANFVANYPLFTSEFVFGNLFESLSRLGVPLFLMISGSLFLDERREFTLKSILSKNVKSIAIITIIWATVYSVVFNIIFPLLTGDAVSIKSVISGMINGHFHMWYLYMIIGVYIITPFLKKFVCKENKGMVLFFIIISFCFRFLTPIINAMCELGLNLSFINKWVDKFHLGFFDGYITYFLVGWYIVHIGIKQKWLTYGMYFFGASALAFMVIFVHFTGDYNNVYQNIGAPVFVYSVSVFLALNSINFNLKEKNAKKLVLFSKLTFGVYIIHVLVLSIFTKIFPYSNYCVLYIVLRFAIVVCISFFISYIISKIPMLKRIIKA